MNDNMPFDQFVTEQLAGDLIPNASQSQRVATAFCRNHTYNGEGGRIADETRVENTMDRTETLGTVFLGLTVTCTRCHDHKFDPIYQKEYYQLYAFFNQCSETGSGSYAGGGNAFPVMNYASAEQEQKLAAAKSELAAVEKKLADAMPQIDAAQADWEKTFTVATGEAPWIVADPQSFSTRSGATLKKLDDKSLLASGTLPITDEYDLIVKIDQANLTGMKLEMLGDPSLPHGGPGRALENGNFVLTAIEGEAVSVADAKQTKPLAFNAAASQADYSQPGWLVGGAVDNNPGTGWAGQGAPKKEMTAQFVFRAARRVCRRNRIATSTEAGITPVAVRRGSTCSGAFESRLPRRQCCRRRRSQPRSASRPTSETISKNSRSATTIARASHHFSRR